MTIENILATKTNTIEIREVEIRTMAETVKSAINNDSRYSAFPQTSSVFPLDLNDIVPDQLGSKYDNEIVSLDDIGISNAEFNSVTGIGFQYIKNNTVGYFIEWYIRLTVDNTIDVDYMHNTYNIDVSVSDIVKFKKVIDYEGISFDFDWYPVIEETL